MAELHDFGEKIGGARKDVWASRGLLLTDTEEMTDVERVDFIKKDNVWPRPDWVKIVQEGTPQVVAYWQNKMRQSIPPKPPKADKETQDNYVKITGEIRKAVMAVKEPHEIESFYKDFLFPNYLTRDYGRYVKINPGAESVITNKVVTAAQGHLYNLRPKAEKEMFGIPKDQQVYVATKKRFPVLCYDEQLVKLQEYDVGRRAYQISISRGLGADFAYIDKNTIFADKNKWILGSYFVVDSQEHKPVKINFTSRDEALQYVEKYAQAQQTAANKAVKNKTKKTDGKKRKGSFAPPQLAHVRRTGPDYRKGRPATPEMFLEDIQFRGGEFGNWLNDNDRQTSLDMAYDALRDFSRILQVRPEDISLDKSLAIAFGARGKGGVNAGAAHYEPGRQVINLTKMSGAGCLAHEWGHALDHAIGIAAGMPGFASEVDSKTLPQSFKDLMQSLRYKEIEATDENVMKEAQQRIDNSTRNLSAWIDSEKPTIWPATLREQWEAAKKEIIENCDSFSGIEYQTLRRGEEPKINEFVEYLNSLRKVATRHGLSKQTRQQICIWARDLSRQKEALATAKGRKVSVKTDYYKGSSDFDTAYSKMGHGYWSSSCEMFARAFDCYISDKIKESGLRSDYLSARADCFVMQDSKGKQIAAIPLGEERKVINEKFDVLIKDLKERGLLHQYEETIEVEKPKEPPAAAKATNPTVRGSSGASRHMSAAENKPQRFEQLSFDFLVADAMKRHDQQVRDSSKTASPRRPDHGLG